MKPRILSPARLSFALASALASLLAAPLASAATLYWDGTTPASWNTNTNWSTASGSDTPDPAAVPGALDDAVFNITTVNGAETITLDANQAARGITFNNTDTTTLTGGGTARTLTLGVGGMTMSASAGAVTLGDGTAGNDVLISLATGAQTWTNNHASNAFTINNTVPSFSRVTGSTLTFNQASTGLFSINTTALPNDATGIIGRWAFFGTGGTQRYAVNNAGTMEGYSAGSAAATANDFGSATTNYDLTTAAVTLTGSRTANTFRSAGAGGAISLGASGSNSLTLNGILAVGSGTLTIQDTGSTGTLVVGSSNELVIAGPQNVTIDTQITAGAGRTLTYAGTGTLQISGSGGSSATTFTGNLNVNSGTFNNVTTQSLTNSIDVTTFVAAGATYNWQGAFGAGLTATKPWTVNGTLTKTGNGDTSFSSSAPISGTGAISLNGQANVTLNGDNSGFTGTFTEGQSAGTALTLGHNRALGAGTFIFSGNLPVQSTVSNFTNPNVTALRFSNDRTFQGSNNMNLGTGAVTLNSGNRTLTVTGITLTLGGAIGQDIAGRQFTKAGTGTLVLTGNGSTYSGGTVISAGTLDLGGGTANGSLLSTGTLTLGGGTFSYTRTGTNTQSFATTNFNAAPANVLSVAAGNTLNLGSIVRGAGVSYDFSTVAGGGIVAANLSNNSAAGIMSPYFTFGANNWAVANGPGVAISAYTGYTQTSGGGITAGNYTGGNIDVDNNAGTLTAGITSNSVRFNSSAANTLSLTGANVITSGGILVGTGVGANLSTISGGTLTGAASSPLAISQNNTLGGLTISSNIINNTATTLDKFGPGLLTLSGTNTYTGTTTIYGGTLAVSGGAAIANAGLVTLANAAGVAFQLNSNETIGNLSGGGTTGGTVDLGGNTLTLGDTSTDKTYAGAFTGSGTSSIVKQGTGTSTFSNTTAIPGTLTINAGTWVNSQSNFSGGTITLNANGATLLFNSSGGGSAGVSGLGGGVISNAIVLGNAVTTTGANLFANGNQGRWNFTGGITGAPAAAGAQTLFFKTTASNNTGGDRTTTTVSGVIANGNQALNLNFNISPQSASATNAHPTYVNLTGLNTFTGNITATRGGAGNSSWLVIGGERWSDGANNTPSYGRMGSGRLGDNNSGVYAGNFALGGTAGNVVNLSYFSSANQTWSGTIGTGGVNNNGALVKEGTGTLTLTAANGYNSATTIGGGTLALDFNTGVTTTNILPSGTPLWMGLGSTYDPIPANADMIMAAGPSGGILQLGGTATSATQAVASLNTAANTASTILVGANRTLSISSSTVTAGANSSLNFNTAAGGNNGAIVGTSIVSFGTAPTFTSGFTVTDAGGFGLATVNGTNQVIRNTATDLLLASGATSSTDYRIDNNGGGSGDPGSSTLTISASQSARSITVDTTAGSGVLTLNSGVVLSNNVWNFGGSNNYQITGSASGAGVRPVASNDTMVINNYNTGTVTFTSPILANGANALVVNGVGTTVLNGLNTFTGATTISGGTLQIGATGRLVGGTYAGGITIGNGSLFRYSGSNAQTLSGAITGAGALTKDTNTSDLTLSSTSNTYTGNTTVSSGRIIATAVTNLSSGATRLVQSGAGQFFLNGAVNFANPINISSTGYVEGADNQNNVSGAIRLAGSTLSGPITLSGNSRISSYGSVANGTNTNTISGQITGGFGIDFYGFQNQTGTSQVFVLSNTANNYTGATTIINSNYNTTNLAGVSTTLRLGASNVIPDGASAGNVAFAINGTNNNATTILDLNGFNETINGLTVNAGTFATRITNTAAATSASLLTVGANDTTSSFSGTITDSGAGRTLALTKIGNGILTLSGTSNSYIGATTVSAGTLAVTGSLGATAVSVNAGTLSGNGNFGGNVSIASGATHAIAVAATPGAQDTSAITGTLTLTAGNILNLSAASTPASGVYVLATAATISGTPTTINYNGISGTVTVDTVSSPQRLLLTVNADDTTPPTLTSINDNVSGGPVDINTPITYTVTFSEDINASTVSDLDFGNAGTAPITIGAITETSPGVFTVVVTPTNSGSVQLRINQGAVIEDTATIPNALVTTSALLDNTTITVRTIYESWANTNSATGGKAGDPDGDGYNNLMEFAFDTNPTTNSAASIAYSGGVVTAHGQPILVQESGTYYAVFGRRVNYVAAGLVYTVEFSAGLDQWTSSATGLTTVATDGVIDAIRVPFPNLVSTPSGPKKPTFFRVVISEQ